MPSSAPQNVPAETRQHVVMFPLMAQGHIIPFLDLSKLIATRSGFTVTIVNTPLNIQSLRPKIESAREANFALDIRLAELPFSGPDHGLPPYSENTESLSYPLILTLLEASEHLYPHFERLIHQIWQEDGRLPLCIISDMFLSWTLDVADMFGIPNLSFCTCGVYGLLISYSLWIHLPHIKIDSDEFVLPDMPNVSLHRSQLNEALKTATVSNRWTSFHIRQISRSMRSWGFICNTFEDLDHGSLEQMRKSTGRPVWAVGPLLPSVFLSSSPQPYADNKSVLMLRGKEAESDVVACLRWLDSHEPSTVLYVSFGTQNTISVSHMRELALGLESSGVPFVWVVRPPLGVPLNSDFSPEFFPNGFEERIKKKNQGLVVMGWAPQLMILSHPSTGGFLSHCGWNSVLESVSQGVPIIGWPMAGEQFYNSKLLEEDVGVCVEMWRGKEGELSKEKVEKTVRTLMREEKGRGMREKAMEIRDAARKAVREGQADENKKGSSIGDLDEMIKELLVPDYKRQSSFG